MSDLDFFNKNGYIIKDIFNTHELNSFKNDFYYLVVKALDKKNLLRKYTKKIKNKDFILNKAFIDLDKLDHSMLEDIYRMIQSSTSLLSLTTNRKIISIIKKLMCKKYNLKSMPFFLNSISCRMDPPGLNEFLYGWHHDYMTNIKQSIWTQIWFPIINESIGGLDILPGSHLKNFDDQLNDLKLDIEKKSKGKILRMPYNAKIDFCGLEPLNIKLSLGQVIFFHNKLIHRSGLNKSKDKVRYAITTFFHDTLNDKFQYKPHFININK